jgi:hypothetical protein
MTNIVLSVRSDTFTSDCTLLNTVPPTSIRNLVHRNGEPFRLLESFKLLPGTEITVFGYTDVVNNNCTGAEIEVISISLGAIPAVTPEDTDGDLISDSLELLFFAGLGQDGAGDFDGDGFSNLQEILDGSDPGDKFSKGVSPISLAPPKVELVLTPGGDLKLKWKWPSKYANKIKFVVQSSTDLNDSFSNFVLFPVPIGEDTYEVSLPKPSDKTRFYLVKMQLP